MNLEGVLAQYDLYEAIQTFCDVTGWESTRMGEWNCKFDKPVTFAIEYEEECFFQREQDYVYFFTPGDQDCDEDKEDPDWLTKEDILKLYATKIYDKNKYQGHGIGWYEYQGHKILRITMGAIVRVLITESQLPHHTEIVLRS